ncbi:SNF2 family N terminal domain [Trypanosoma vivax]|nr:SNF2 family N terminal domain [Trypanosoma vivax]
MAPKRGGQKRGRESTPSMESEVVEEATSPHTGCVCAENRSTPDGEPVDENEDSTGYALRALEEQLERGRQQRAASAISQGGLVKPSAREDGLFWSCTGTASGKKPNLAGAELGVQERREVLKKHLAHYVRYTFHCNNRHSSFKFVSAVSDERDTTKASGNVSLLRFAASLPCVWRFIIHEWRRAVSGEEAEASLPEGGQKVEPPAFCFRIKSLLMCFAGALKTVGGLCALLFIACPACRKIYLATGATPTLVQILLETGRVSSDDILMSTNKRKLVADALEKLDSELSLCEDSAGCEYWEAHRQLLLLLSHCMPVNKNDFSLFNVTLNCKFSSLFEALHLCCVRRRGAVKSNRGAPLSSALAALCAGAPCEMPVKNSRRSQATSAALSGSSVADSDSTKLRWYTQLLDEVKANETKWAEDSCKTEIEFSVFSCFRAKESMPERQLILREAMGAFFTIYCAVSERTSLPHVMLESVTSRIAALFRKSLTSGIVPTPKRSSMAPHNDSSEESCSEEDSICVRDAFMARGTYRNTISVQNYIPFNSSAAEVLSGVSSFSVCDLTMYVSAMSEFFPHEYIRARLMPHQMESLAFMMMRETKGLAEYMELPFNAPLNSVLPREDGDGKKSEKTHEDEGYSLFYSSLRSECFVARSSSLAAHLARQRKHCGFLCDEMGLGKTLVVLSLCASSRKLREMKMKDEDDDEKGEGEEVDERNHASGSAGACRDGSGNDGADGESNYDDYASQCRMCVQRPKWVEWPKALRLPPCDASACTINLQKPTPLPHTTLLVIPYSLLPQWVSEIDCFYPTARYVIFHGPSRFRYTIMDFMSADFVITTYETLNVHLRTELDVVFRLFGMFLPEKQYDSISLKELEALSKASPHQAEDNQSSGVRQPGTVTATQENVMADLIAVVNDTRREISQENGTTTGSKSSQDVLRDFRRNARSFVQSDAFRFTDLIFERIVLDESQRCSSSELLYYLHARYRWVVSGTPINNNSSKSLDGLFRFLRVSTSPGYMRIDGAPWCVGVSYRDSFCINVVNAYRKARGLRGYALRSTAGSGEESSAHNRRLEPLPSKTIRCGPCFCRGCSPYCLRDGAEGAPLLARRDSLLYRLSRRGPPSHNAADSNCDSNYGEDDESYVSAVRRCENDQNAIARATHYFMYLAHFMVRHEKNASIEKELLLAPVQETRVEVPLLAGERFIYDYAAAIVREEASLLQRQGLLGNCTVKVLNWVRLLTHAALHPSTILEELRDGAQSLRRSAPVSTEVTDSVDTFASSFVVVSPSDALHFATIGTTPEASATKGGSKKLGPNRGSETAVAPESTIDVLQKLLRVPPELPNCSICLDTMLTPTLLRCFHMFCKECLVEIAHVTRSSASYGATARCPCCRDRVSIQGKKWLIDMENVEKSAPCPQQRHATKTDERVVPDEVLKAQLATVGKGSRVSRLVELLGEIWQKTPDDGILVFSKVPAVLQIGAEALREVGYSPVYMLDSRISLAGKRKMFSQLHALQRAAAVGNEEVESGRFVLFLSSRTASAGLNLTFANHLVFMEPNMNPALHQQAIGRIDRCGQTKQTHVYVMYSPDTIEQKILRRTSEILSNYAQRGAVDQAGAGSQSADNQSDTRETRCDRQRQRQTTANWRPSPTELQALLL